MVGATSSAAGTAGLVPQPAAGDQDLPLHGSATFKPVRHIFPRTRSSWATTQSLQTQIINATADAIRTWPSSGILFFNPIWVAEDTYNRIGSIGNSTNPATATFRIALYTSNADTNMPDALVSGSNQTITLAAGGAGNANLYATVSLNLKAGIYWIAMAQESATWSNGFVLCMNRDGSFAGTSPMGVAQSYGFQTTNAYLHTTANNYWTAGTSNMPSDCSGITFQSPSQGFNRPVGFLAKV